MRRRISALALLTLLAFPLPAGAANKTIDIAALRKVVGNLGYEDSTAGGDRITINNGSTGDYAITLSLAGDGSIVYINYVFDSIQKDKMSIAALGKLLKYNDTGAVYYALSTDDKGLYFPVLIGQIPSADLTPQSLRAQIDYLAAQATSTKELWDAKAWPADVAGGAK